MSELTPCNYCNLRDLRSRYGEENVRARLIIEPESEMRGWIAAEVKQDGQWTAHAWFLQLTTHCAC